MVSRSVSFLGETKLALAALLHSLQIKINYREFHSNEGFKLIMKALERDCQYSNGLLSIWKRTRRGNVNAISLH